MSRDPAPKWSSRAFFDIVCQTAHDIDSANMMGIKSSVSVCRIDILCFKKNFPKIFFSEFVNRIFHFFPLDLHAIQL